MAKTRPRMHNGTAAKGGKARFYVTIALLIPVAVVMLPTFIVLAAAMVPALVAWVIDPYGRRYLAPTVAALNFAGSLFFLVLLWTDVNDVPHALAVLRNVYGWLIAYGGAAAGYGVYYAMPRLTEGIVRLRADTRLKRLEKQMRELVQEWGDAVGAPRRQ